MLQVGQKNFSLSALIS